MPGPPRGPSYRITITSPGWYERRSTAAKASSSQSKQRAGPRKRRLLIPATLTIAPWGARLPQSPTTPPVGVIGSLAGRTTSCPAGKTTSARFSATVRPVTVRQSPCR